jgi:hypothetical protein
MQKGKPDCYGCWPTVEIKNDHIVVYNNSPSGGIGQSYKLSDAEDIESLLVKVIDDYSSIRQKIQIDTLAEALKRLNNNDQSFVIVDGWPYTIAAEDDRGAFRGFGGRKFIIEFFDGRIVETTNLWMVTQFGEAIRKHLPDNAKFLKEKAGQQ